MMVRHKPKSRRQVQSNDSSNDSDGEAVSHKAVKLTIDPKIALSIVSSAIALGFSLKHHTE